MKRGAGEPMWIIIIAVIAVFAALFYMFFIGDGFKAAHGTISPAILQAKIESCEIRSQDGGDNMDSDPYIDMCDPCIDVPDYPEYDGNDNGVADYCEAEGSTGKKIKCYGTVTIGGEEMKNQCCAKEETYKMTSGLEIVCTPVDGDANHLVSENPTQ